MAVPTIAVGGGGNSGNKIVLSWPAGWQAGDIGVVVIESSGEGATIPTVPSASPGWAHIPGSPFISSADAAGSQLSVLWKRATSSEASFDSGDSGDHQLGRLFAIRGCIAEGDPFEAPAGGTNASASSLSIPSITTLGTDRLIFLVGSRPDDNSSTTWFGTPVNTNLASITDQWELGSTTGNGGGAFLSTGVKTTAGAIGTTSVSMAATTVTNYAIIAFRADAGSGGGPAVLTGTLSATESGSDTFAGTSTVGSTGLSTASLSLASSVSGTATSPANALGATDGTFTTDTNGVSWAHRFSFGSSNPNPGDPTGTQTINVVVRNSGNTGVPTIASIELLQGGAQVAANLLAQAHSVASATGETLVVTFSGDLLTSLNGVEVVITTTAAGGGPAVRSSVQLDSATWIASYSTLVQLTGTLAATETGSDTFAGTGSLGSVALATRTGTLAATESGSDTFAGTGILGAPPAAISQFFFATPF